jgi:hypothetical protein
MKEDEKKNPHTHSHANHKILTPASRPQQPHLSPAHIFITPKEPYFIAIRPALHHYCHQIAIPHIHTVSAKKRK